MIHVGSPDTINHFQACSIESAATMHPSYNVCLAMQVRSTVKSQIFSTFYLYTIQVTDENYDFKSVLRRMKNIDNLKIFPIETDTIVEWSPAREVFKILGEEIQGSIWNHIHLSRILRFAERAKSSKLSEEYILFLLDRLSWLWKFGGLYLDTDVLILNNLISKFSNESFVSLQSLHPQRGFSNSVVQLSRFRNIDNIVIY